MDIDNDEMVSEAELVNWFKEEDGFSWMTYDEIKSETWDKIATNAAGDEIHRYFEQTLVFFSHISEIMELYREIVHILGEYDVVGKKYS